MCRHKSKNMEVDIKIISSKSFLNLTFLLTSFECGLSNYRDNACKPSRTGIQYYCVDRRSCALNSYVLHTYINVVVSLYLIQWLIFNEYGSLLVLGTVTATSGL